MELTGSEKLKIKQDCDKKEITVNDLSRLISLRNKKINFAGKLTALGDSITYGTGTSGPGYEYPATVVGYNIQDSTGGFTNLAVPGTTSTTCALSAFASQPKFNKHANSDILSICIGVNDIGFNGGPSETILKIAGAYRSIIVNQLLREAIPASGLTNTGTWSNWTVQPIKAVNLSGNARQTSTINDELTFTTTSPSDNIVVGTVNSNGTTKDYGRFVVFVDGEYVGFFDPNFRTDSINDTFYTADVSPDVFVVEGLRYSTHNVRIVAIDAKPTVIDYLGWLNVPQKCGGVIVIPPPECTPLGFRQFPGQKGTNEAIADVVVALKGVVNEFINYPVVLSDTKAAGYDPFRESFDGLHPNDNGHAKFTKAVQATIFSNTSIQYPSVEIVSLNGAKQVFTDLSRAANARKYSIENVGGQILISQLSDDESTSTVLVKIDEATKTLSILNSGGFANLELAGVSGDGLLIQGSTNSFFTSSGDQVFRPNGGTEVARATGGKFKIASGNALQIGNTVIAGAPSLTTPGYVTMRDDAGTLFQVPCFT